MCALPNLKQNLENSYTTDKLMKFYAPMKEYFPVMLYS